MPVTRETVQRLFITRVVLTTMATPCFLRCWTPKSTYKRPSKISNHFRKQHQFSVTKFLFFHAKICLPDWPLRDSFFSLSLTLMKSVSAINLVTFPFFGNGLYVTLKLWILDLEITFPVVTLSFPVVTLSSLYWKFFLYRCPEPQPVVKKFCEKFLKFFLKSVR